MSRMLGEAVLTTSVSSVVTAGASAAAVVSSAAASVSSRWTSVSRSVAVDLKVSKCVMCMFIVEWYPLGGRGVADVLAYLIMCAAVRWAAVNC